MLCWMNYRNGVSPREENRLIETRAAVWEFLQGLILSTLVQKLSAWTWSTARKRLILLAMPWVPKLLTSVTHSSDGVAISADQSIGGQLGTAHGSRLRDDVIRDCHVAAGQRHGERAYLSEGTGIDLA